MPQFPRPGIFVIEKEALPRVVGVGVGAAGFVGVAERGPVDEAILVTSFNGYNTRFGGFFGGSALPHAVRAFFNEGGTIAFIARVVQAETKASLTTGVVVSNNAIDWAARVEGPAGNDISVELLDPGSPYSALSVTVTSKKISVSLETDGAAALVSTATAVIIAVAAVDDAVELVTLSDSGASDGTGIVTALSETNLTGGAGAARATRAFEDYDGTENALRASMRDPGAFGNNFTIDLLKADTTTSAALVTGATSIAVADVVDLDIGDLVRITDGTTTVDVIIITIDSATRTLTFAAITIGTTIASGATVRTALSHRVRTTLKAALVTGADRAELNDAGNVVAGQRIFFTDGTTSATAVVDRRSGNTVFFTSPITLASPLAANDIVVSLEFNLVLKEADDIIETFEFLSMDNGNARDYIGVRLTGDSNESLNIELADLESATADALRAMPVPVKDRSLLDGDDGTTPGNTEFIGSDVDPKSGISLFDEIKDVEILLTPGITTVQVIANGVDLAEARGDIMYIFSAPESDDLPQEVIEFTERELNKDSSFGAIYYPQLKIPDPEDVDRTLVQASDGWVAGEYADVAATRGIHKAPANVTLRGVLGLTHNTTDGEHDLLNPRGINVIRSFPGRGIRIFGARTLSRRGDDRKFVNVRRTLNLIKKSLVRGNQAFLFEPIDIALFTSIRSANESFLLGLWRDGTLVPSDDPSRAFFVKVDAETTPPDVQALGRVNVEIGVNVSKPAETIVFSLSLFSGSISIEESLG